MDSLIAAASKSPERKSDLVMAMMKSRVFIFASWPSAESNVITFQNFILNGESYIPIFSDEKHFREETKGSPYEKMGVEIDSNFLASLLKGDELFILNPRSQTPIRIIGRELKGFLDPKRLPK